LLKKPLTTGELIKRLQEKDKGGRCKVFVDAQNGDGEEIEVLDSEPPATI